MADLALVDLAALGLAVGPVRPADVRALVPGQAHPAQGAQDGRLGIRGRARAVGVLDAQDELAAVLLGEDVVEQGDVGGPDVGIARGRGRDANANGHGGRHKSALARGSQAERGTAGGRFVNRPYRRAARPGPWRRVLPAAAAASRARSAERAAAEHDRLGVAGRDSLDAVAVRRAPYPGEGAYQDGAHVRVGLRSQLRGHEARGLGVAPPLQRDGNAAAGAHVVVGRQEELARLVAG